MHMQCMINEHVTYVYSHVCTCTNIHEAIACTCKKGGQGAIIITVYTKVTGGLPATLVWPPYPCSTKWN